MKKLIAFIASGMIPTFIPICALLTLPICLAERYIPQDLQKSFAYGISFFKLVINPYVNTSSPTVSREDEVVPVVESTVTSMAVAAEVECEDMPLEAELIEPSAIAVLNKDQFAYTTVQMKDKFHKAQSEMKQLQYLRNMKLAVPAEKFEIAIENAVKNMETRMKRAQAKKRDHRSLRVLVRKKAQIPA